MGTKNTETQAAGGAPAPDPRTREELLAENASLKGQLGAFEAERAQNAELEQKVLAKTARGLIRDQALAVIRRQEEFDRAPAKPGAKKK